MKKSLLTGYLKNLYKQNNMEELKETTEEVVPTPEEEVAPEVTPEVEVAE